MARKTAKDYRRELSTLDKEKKALENRIRKRAFDLCETNPDLAILSEAKILPIESYLSIIEAIEKELAKRHPHKQTTIEGF